MPPDRHAPRSGTAPRAPRPEDAVTNAAVGLGRALRAEGLVVGVDRELVFCRALAEVDLRHRSQVYWAARGALVASPHDVPIFEPVFERFWRGTALSGEGAGVQHGETDPRMPGPQHGGDSLPQFRLEGRSRELLDGQASRASQQIPTAATKPEQDDPTRVHRGLLAAYSPAEVLAGQEPLRYARDELTAVRRLAEELRDAVPERRSRRLRPSRRPGRLDVRRTVRGALRTDGEVLRPAYVANSRKPQRLLFLCDVSGSMERYSRALLAALQAVVGAGLKAETFVFATRLTRLTGALGTRDAARALERARATVADWSGGTRIGPTLAEFNRTHGRRGLARGAIVIIVSDGWDRGHPDILSRELERLRLQARRLVWLNPRPDELEGQPLAIGMRAALPYVDDFVPGHDPRALARLGQLIGGLDAGRPPRRQRPIALERR